MTLGHQFLKEEFDYIPTYGWNIDNFGHSAIQASLFSQMGFSSFVVSRIDYEDKAQRIQNKGLEMVWAPIQKSKENNSIFLHVSYNHYSAPRGFGFDINGGKANPIVDNNESTLYNIDKRANI